MHFKFAAILVLVLVLTATPSFTAYGKNDNGSSNGQGQSNNQGNSQGNQGNQGNQNNQDNQDNNGKSENTSGSSNGNKPSSSNTAKALKTTASTATSSGRENCDPNYPWKNHGEYVSCVAKLKLGGQSVSDAAKSDIGKKNNVASSSASPTATGSASPSASPESTSSGLIANVNGNFKSVKKALGHFKDQLKALLELLNPLD